MTSALVVSRMFPASPQMVHGVFQRLGVQVQALGRVVDRVECLFLAEDSLHLTAADIEAHRARMAQQWSANVALTVAPVARAPSRTNRWLRFGAEMLDFYSLPIAREVDNPGALAAVAAALRAGPDLVLAHRLTAMATLMRLKDLVRKTPLFFDMDDIEHLATARRLLRKPEWPGEQLKLLQIPCLLRAEIAAIRLSRSTFICSQSDRRYLERFVAGGHLQVVPNSTRLPQLHEADHSQALVLFVGSMIYPPNAVAADTLVRDIWPQILAHLPDAQLVIAGARPDLIPAYAGAPRGVRFAGFVDDLGELYPRARVVCCPILYGGGTRVKIIEAAAYGCAIVATPLAAEGLDFRDGREILIRNNSAALAQECVRLLQKPDEARQLGAAARALALKAYDREAVLAQLEQLFRGALGVAGPSGLS